jgi:Zn-dependent alcohol dehydrogenase
MKTKAAVAVAVRKPLEIITVDLDGPRAGEVLVEIKASGVCHTDEFTRSGADPEGLFPAILGHEGAGIVVDVGPGKINIDDLITHRMRLGDINKAFDLMHSGESIRSVVVYS